MPTDQEADSQAAAPQPRTAVVIVTREQSEHLAQCLESLRGASIVVVDNGSGDVSPEMEAANPAMRVMRLPRHFSFTKALNIGLRAVEDVDAVLLLSPDVTLAASDLEPLRLRLEQDATAGAVAPLLLSSAGTAAQQVAELPSPNLPDPAFGPAQPGSRVANASGDALLFRSLFFRALRQVDERYGEFGSAMELCQQVRRAGKSILIDPTVTATIRPTPREANRLESVDRLLGVGAFLGKHFGFAAGLSFWLKQIFAAIFTLRWSTAALLIQQKKFGGL